MEMVLDVYRRPYERRFPVICMDESPRQLIDEVKTPIPGAPGRPARYDYEYKRHGVCNVFMANEPLAGRRMVKLTERKTKQDWDSEVYRDARRCRSAVESSMFTIKAGFAFGELGRRGIDAVRDELLEKVLAYNGCRSILMKQRRR